jgi:hypothetical protein
VSPILGIVASSKAQILQAVQFAVVAGGAGGGYGIGGGGGGGALEPATEYSILNLPSAGNKSLKVGAGGAGATSGGAKGGTGVTSIFNSTTALGGGGGGTNADGFRDGVTGGSGGGGSRTSYNGRIRYNYAGKGYVYDSISETHSFRLRMSR